MDLNSKLQEMGEAFDAFKKANDERLTLVEKGSAVPAELTEKVNGISKTIGDLELSIKEAQTELARRQKASAVSVDSEKAAQAATDFYKMACKRRGVVASEDFTADNMKAYSGAFDAMMRKGDLMGVENLKALSVGSDPDGGYLVTPDTSGRIVTKVFESSPMRQYASVQTIGTDALEGVYDLDEAGAGWVGETQARTETTTPKLDVWRIPVHEMYAKPHATQKLLDDASVNVEMWLSNKVSDKFARQESTAFVNGDGNGKPRGFLTYSDGTNIPGTIERFNTGANGAFAGAGNGGDVFMDVIYGLKAAYRNGARFAMGRKTLAEVRKLKDGDGNYIWQPGLAAGQPSTLAGFQIAEFEDMPNIAAGSLSIAFANWAEAYQIVDRQGVRVLRDPYSSKPFIEFYTTKRVGGDVINFEAIKLIEFSA